MTTLVTVRRKSAGSIMTALLGITIVCAGFSTAVLMTNTGRQKTANAALARERAFQLAEAGVDWAIAQVRIRNGGLPADPEESRTVPGNGRFRVRYTAGDANGRDDDGDGVADNSAEANYVALYCVGTSGGISRAVEVTMRKSVEVPTFESAIQFNVETPILDLNGNAFRISGYEHTLEGVEDGAAPAKPGIASPADPADLVAQIPSSRWDSIGGQGGTPSVARVDAIDLARIVEQARAAAEVVLEPGTHSGVDLGEPTEAGVTVAYCEGDLHLSGGSGGAGVLVVDGDLRISGGFEWVGIVLVRGRVEMVGGGGGKRIVGALVVGEEITDQSSTTEVTVSGTVDLLASTDAVELAAQRLAILTVMAWREIGLAP